MEALNFIVAHWEKLAFIGAAIGYILKVILDHTYKKKEIYYNLYSSEEMKAVLGFFKQYNNLQLEISYFIGAAKHKKFTREELYKIEESVKQYLDTAMTASFFLNESNMAGTNIIKNNFQDTLKDLFNVFTNTNDVVLHSVALTDATTNFQKKMGQNQTILKDIKKQFVK